MLRALRVLLRSIHFAVLIYVLLLTSCLAAAVRRGSSLGKWLALAGAAALVIVPVVGVLVLLNRSSDGAAATPVAVPSFSNESLSQPVVDHQIEANLAKASSIQGTVVSVVNGDTLDIQFADGSSMRVRLLGMDAPEDEMCFGAEASIRAGELATGAAVIVETDPSQTDRDKFGRFYRYVRLPDGRLLNEVMIEEGFAYEYTYFVPYQYQVEFRAAQAAARDNQRGLWQDGGCGTTSQRPAKVESNNPLMMAADVERGEVVKVRDGDTIEVTIAGTWEPVRLIGIDTPEIGACFADDASARMKELVVGGVVFLERDQTQDNRDIYDRLLRYVWLPDGQLVNYVLVREGFAYEYTYRAAYRFVDAFMQAENAAQREGLGLWSPLTCNGDAGRRSNYRVYGSN